MKFWKAEPHCGHRQTTCSSLTFSLTTAPCQLLTSRSTAKQTTSTADLSTFLIQRYPAVKHSWFANRATVAGARVILIYFMTYLSPVSIQTQSLALRVLRKRKPQETQAANYGCHCFDRAFLLAGACVCCVNCLPTQALAFRAVFFYATHKTQAIAFEYEPGFRLPFTIVSRVS